MAQWCNHSDKGCITTTSGLLVQNNWKKPAINDNQYLNNGLTHCFNNQQPFFRWTQATQLPLELSVAFSALTLLAGRQEEHLDCKNWVMRCWHGCLPGARCKVFAYDPADVTATPSSLESRITCLVPAYPRCPGTEDIKWVFVCLFQKKRWA